MDGLPLLKDTELDPVTISKLERHGKTTIYQLAEMSEIDLKLYSLRYDEIQEVKDLLRRYSRHLVGD